MEIARFIIVKLLQKTRLNKVAHKVYYSYFHGFKAAHGAVLPAVETCLKKAVELGTAGVGDYYEFGIFKGYTFWFAQQAAQRLGLKNMRFLGFDSFAGLPKVEGRDETEHGEFYEGQYSCTNEAVVTNLSASGVDWERTFLIEGLFEQSLNEQTKKEYGMNQISVALIDCDLYSSTVEVLDFIKDMHLDKAILLFDDWNCFDGDDERGQRKAFKDFLKNNKQFRAEEFIAFGGYGQTFIINNT